MPGHAKLDNNSKVVPLEPENQRIVRAKLARLPASIHSVHEKGRHLLLGLLKSFFDRADDSLFELADKALSNQEQNLYFDSMREVRVQRRGIEQRFSEAVDEAFAALVTPSEPNDSKPIFTSPDALSLVEHDELEEMVAVDSSVARANQEFGEAIQLISLRLDSLVPVKVYQKNNPLGPDLVFATFIKEAKKLDVGIKAKLVLFKLFDKTVVGRLSEVYGPINEIFKEHNVLPSLSTPAGHNQARRRGDDGSLNTAVSQAYGAVPADSGLSPEVLATLKTLFAERSAPVANVARQSTSQAATELVQLLSRVQQMPAVRDSKVAINVRALLAQLQQQAGARATIGQVDDQVMNLVNLLFDFILEDRNLAPPMKALISRMQIPIIKVAVADKTFFTKGGHVARRLLNELATAAIGWTGSDETIGKDPLYQKIDTIIRQLNQDFDTDVAIFADLLADFSAFLEKEKKRAAVLERRTIDAEDGKAKAEVARITVALEIEIRTLGVQLPTVVSHLIEDAWSNVLFVTALKHGFEAEEWRVYLSVLDDLIWSVQTPKSLEHRQSLIRLVPTLLKKLRSGLDTISYNPFEMSDLFKSLEKIHISCIRGRPVANAVAKSSAASPQPSRGAASARPAETSATSAAAASQPRHPAPSAASVPQVPIPEVKTKSDDLPEPSLRDLARGMEIAEVEEGEVEGGGEVMHSSELVSPQPTARHDAEMVPPAVTHLAPDDPFMMQVARFSQGMWFDMQDKRGQNMRCRLAAFIKPTGKYIFVNRNGMKVAEKTQVELALALRDNALSALDNSVLFDRALETVVSSLRKT